MNTLLTSATALALLHITPVVVLVKREEAVKRILPGATAFTAREVRLSAADAHRLHETLDWGPEEGVLTFYTGKQGGSGAPVGALTFLRVDTQHGPIEVAVGFDPQGGVTRVAVTKATVETKPWMLQAVRSGVLDHYAGLKAGSAPGGAAAYRGKVGRMASYMIEQIDKGVARAAVAYGLFYRSGAVRSDDKPPCHSERA